MTKPFVMVIGYRLSVIDDKKHNGSLHPTTQYHACVAFPASRVLLQPHHTMTFMRRVPCKQGDAPVLYTSSACVTRCN